MNGQAHFRSQARKPCELRVRYRTGGAFEREATTRDLGIGGAFLETRDPPSVGVRLELVLTAPTAWEPLVLAGRVAWHRDESGDEPRGFGMRFDPLSPGQAGALHALLEASGFEEPSP